MNSTTPVSTVPLVIVGLSFVVIYSLIIFLLFRIDKWGRRRRWLAMDWVWVPLGALAGAFLIALWWRMR